MKLNPLTDEERRILRLVVEEYYSALPPALQVHSLFATHILSHTLHRFGIRTRVLPCRLWCSSLQPSVSSHRDNVGGLVNYWNPEKWNGHVVCLVGDWLVDAALYHLNPAFNYEVPKIIARRIVRPEPGIYARYPLNRSTEFVWYRLPAKAAAVSVAGYEDFIDRFVNDLVSHLRRLLGYEEESLVNQPEADLSPLAHAGISDEMSVMTDGEHVTPEELVSGDGAGFSAETAATSDGPGSAGVSEAAPIADEPADQAQEIATEPA